MGRIRGERAHIGGARMVAGGAVHPGSRGRGTTCAGARGQRAAAHGRRPPGVGHGAAQRVSAASARARAARSAAADGPRSRRSAGHTVSRCAALDPQRPRGADRRRGAYASRGDGHRSARGRRAGVADAHAQPHRAALELAVDARPRGAVQGRALRVDARGRADPGRVHRAEISRPGHRAGRARRCVRQRLQATCRAAASTSTSTT